MIDDIRYKARELGLLNRTPIRGTIEIVLTITMFIVYMYIVSNWNNNYSSLLLSLGMTIMFSRAIFIIHDLLHTQYYTNKTFSRYFSYIFIIIVGNSPSWWAKNHHMHHHPWANIYGKDSDITVLDNIFVKKYNNDNNSFIRNHAFILFWLGIFIIYPYFIVQSYITVIIKRKYGELILMVLHGILVWGTLFYFLPTIEASVVMVLVYLLLSLWMGLGFSMNHFGRETFSVIEADKMDTFNIRLRTTRSLKPGYFTHWFYGGLNAHIEHHLFPTASRFKLLELQKFTKTYCSDKAIHYHEDTIYETYLSISRILLGK